MFENVEFRLPEVAFSTFDYDIRRVTKPVVVTLSVPRLNAVLEEHRIFDHVGLNGEGGKIAKYLGVEAWLKKHDYINMPLLDLRVNYSTGVRLNDGRHTFAFLRDHGLMKMKFAIPEDKVHIIINCFGLDVDNTGA